MFRQSIALLVGGSAANIAMRTLGIRSFRDKFHELQARAYVSARRRGSYRVYRNPGAGEAARRVRQNAHQNQLNSHKPGTLQPRHIFGGEQ